MKTTADMSLTILSGLVAIVLLISTLLNDFKLYFDIGHTLGDE